MLEFETEKTAVEVMSEEDCNQLYDLVLTGIVNSDDLDSVADVIYDANNGRLRSFVTTDTLRLFRVYRNRCSANPYRLIAEALAR